MQTPFYIFTAQIQKSILINTFCYFYIYSRNSIFHTPSLKRRSNRFTLIELFVVISIIAIISIMLLPALNASRDKAFKISCTNSLKGLSTGMLQYTVQAPSGMKTKDTRFIRHQKTGPAATASSGIRSSAACAEKRLSGVR